MRILFDHQIFRMQQFGGVSRYFNEISKIAGEDITIEKIDPAILSEFYGQKTDFVSRSSRYIRRRTGFKKEFGKEQTDARLRDRFSGASFDIFHPTYYDPYFLEFTTKPFVLTVFDMIHEIYGEFFQASDKTTHNKRLLCQKASAIISISENTKKDLTDIFQIPAEKIHAIPLGSDFDKVIAHRPPEAENLGKFILFTGNRWGYKNFYFPVMALAEIMKNDRELQLLCTGHAFSAEELSFFRDLEIYDQVKNIYLKDDRELAWAYQTAEFFIFPSLYEGFGFPILEAFASKCPVISSNGGSLPEVGGDGAIYFNPKSVLEIRKAAESILYEPALKKHLVEKGTNSLQRFSWDKCRRETMKVYQSLKN